MATWPNTHNSENTKQSFRSCLLILTEPTRQAGRVDLNGLREVFQLNRTHPLKFLITLKLFSDFFA